MNRASISLLALLMAGPGHGQEVDPQIRAQEKQVGTNAQQKYFLIERKALEAKGKTNGLVVILPGGPGGKEFLPFCANVLTLYGIPEDFVVAELIAPEWSADENRIVWPGRVLRDNRAKFTSEGFLKAVIEDVSANRKIDPRFVFTLGWSSSGHVLYSASVSNEKVTGSIIAMSRFFPAVLPEIEKVRGKNYFLYHSPDDQICPYFEARLAEKTLKEHGANTKLVSYPGGHGWVPNTYYCDRIKEGIEWLQKLNREPATKGGVTNSPIPETNKISRASP